MVAGMLGAPMAEERTNYKGQSVRLPMDVVRMARLITALTDENMGELIAQMARPGLRELMKKHKLPLPKDEPQSE